MTREEILAEINGAPPADRPELYAQYSAIFHSPAAAPPGVPSSPAEAARRLEQLAQTPGYLGKLESGDYETVQEFRRLNALKAEATPFDPLTETGDTSFGPGLDGGPKLSRANTIDAAAWLDGKGASASEIEFTLSDKKYPTADVDAAHYWLPRLEADPSLEVPDLPPGRSRADFVNFLRRIISIGDGSRP
jgi:hypothetical protein